MAIPVSDVVQVDIVIGAQFPQRVGFGTLNVVSIDTGVISLAERIRFYSDLDGVAADWPPGSEVLAAATAYFSQQPKPTKFAASVRFPSAQSAQLRGGSFTDASLLNTIADGSFTISIDGVAQEVTGMNFVGDFFVAIAATIQAAIQAVGGSGYSAATCTYDGTRFLIASGNTGLTTTISFLTPTDPLVGTDISSLLQMQNGEATKSDGTDDETVTASLDAIQNANSDWYGLVFTSEVRENVIINGESAVPAAADWCEARVKSFANTSNDPDVLDSVSTTNIARVLKNKTLRRTMSTYSSYASQYPSASILGRAFTVNFNQPDSTITLKFKQMPTITVENLTSNQKKALDDNNANSLIDVGGNAMFAESVMSSGVFFDEVHGLDWLQNAIQTNTFGYLLTRPTKVPYTDKGTAAIEQQLIKALDEGVRNGLIAPGTTADGEFLATGYKTSRIPVAQVNPSDKEARFYAGLSFVALGAGAIHKLQINGVFER